jgi:signal transduction histidine kinase
LNQVFLNVLNNAIQAIEKKFNHQKGGVLTITTFCTDTTAFISIKDNGIGIPDEIITKIFDPFFTTKEVGQGTGLGLSIAYNTIKKHSGKIQVLSTINEGSEFIIEIPLKQ